MPKRRQPSNLLPDTPAWSVVTRVVIVALMVGVALWLISLAQPVWWMIALALTLSYMLQPIIGLLERLWIPRGLATLLVVILVISAVIILPILLVPILLADIQPLSFDTAAWIGSASIWVQQLPQRFPGFEILDYQINLVPVYTQIAQSLRGVDPTTWFPTPSEWINLINEAVRSAGSVLGLATNIAASVLLTITAIVVGVIFLLVFTLYLAKDLPKLLDTIIQMVPPLYQPEWRELWRRTGKVWNAFFRGQILLSLMVGVATWVGLLLIGVPGALALGMIAGLMEVLPTIGPVLSFIPAGIVALVAGSTIYTDVSHLTIFLAVLALYVLVQQVENYLLVPRVLAGSVGVHPALALIGVLVFALRFGIIGAFLATPVLATLLVWGYYVHARLLGRPPYPEMLASNLAAAPLPAAVAPSAHPDQPPIQASPRPVPPPAPAANPAPPSPAPAPLHPGPNAASASHPQEMPATVELRRVSETQPTRKLEGPALDRSAQTDD